LMHDRNQSQREPGSWILKQKQLNNMDSILTKVICSDVPRPVGHYEQAILHGKTLYVSGQLGVTKDTQNPEKVSVTEQVQFALGNIERIANTVGVGRAAVAKTTVYITDIALWEEANKAYAAFFGNHKPARSILPCNELHWGAKIEIEAIVAL